MEWINSRRDARKARKRADHHQAMIDAAATPRQRLQAACGWLISEATHTNRLDGALEAVLTTVHQLRGEEVSA